MTRTTLKSIAAESQSRSPAVAASYARLSPDLAAAEVPIEFTSFLDELPSRLLWAVGFEARLSRSDDRVDHFLGFDRRRAPLLAKLAEHAANKTSATNHGVWERLGRFASHWEMGGDPIRDVGYLWLEFDEGVDRNRPPGVFLERTAPVELVNQGAWGEEAFEFIRDISGHALSEPIIEMFNRCLRDRPPSTCPASIGFFLSRPHPAVRLCLKGFEPTSLRAFLKRAGWSGDATRTEEVLQHLLDAPQPSPQKLGMLHLDVAESLLPRVGVEFVFDIIGQVRRGRLETPFLDRLIESGWSTEKKAQALRTWPGPHFVRVEPGRPKQLYLRRVNHVKVEFDHHKNVDAKAYFGARMHMPKYLQVGPSRPAFSAYLDHDR